MNDDEIRKAVRERYAGVAVNGKSARSAATAVQPEAKGTTASASCCTPPASAENTSCCDTGTGVFDYTAEQLAAIPEGADLGLGCGNPTALASLKKGEVVLDLGSGGGVDCFIAANRVGVTGRAIGVDMTPEMLIRARQNAAKGGYTNVDFRLGEIEHLPVADNSVDIVISNCVINLSPDKPQVFAEAFRVLKPGGRVMVSDIVLLKELPEAIRKSVAAYTGCIAGASLKEDYLAVIKGAGFRDVSIVSELPLGSGQFAGLASSVNIRAVKPD